MQQKVKVNLEGQSLEIEKGSPVSDVLKKLGADESDCFAVEIGGEILPLDTRIEDDCSPRLLRFSTEEGREIYRHSASHIMASAVKRLFPDVKLGIGPAIEDGFYYDFEKDSAFLPEDLSAIEMVMHEIISANMPFKKSVMKREEAIKLFEKKGENLKVELLKGIEEDTVSVFTHGDFADLCRGPHLPSTGVVKAIKLLSCAGAYWRGSEKNVMLQRIYGTAYHSRKDLEEYLQKLEEAKRRDHRKLGKALELFSLREELGPGLVLWHPKGAALRRVIEDFWKDEHLKRGYELVMSPHIARGELWATSGHLEFYKENMYLLEVEKEQYVLKPMNCPFHILVYQSKKRSYRELPVRYAELGTVYRQERSGVLHGTERVRGFTQDDAHIFCTPEQLPGELVGVLDLAKFMLTSFGFKEFDIDLSVRDPANPAGYAGGDDEWETAESALEEALKRSGDSYKRAVGEAVFYGPKIDIKLRDALGRGWQGPTIQLDFNFPKRFNVCYVGKDGKEHQVFMIHRTVLGSMERFVGTLTEHYAGEFPLWLSPVQVIILTVSEENKNYGQKLADVLRGSGVRCETDFRDEKIGAKVRDAELMKIPYMLVIGKREAESGCISVRSKKGGDLGSFDLQEFSTKLLAENKEKR
ncbi:MAG: threonine--tRNA ligase [Candidatus Eisenbacteria bacterium]|nr:threonine--tRNA ligase [Candidatus Eisenbacteria bacterium]